MDFTKFVSTKVPEISIQTSAEADSEVTKEWRGMSGAIEVWNDLPEEIKTDPSLDPIRKDYEQRSLTSSTQLLIDGKHYSTGGINNTEEKLNNIGHIKSLQDSSKKQEKSHLLGDESKRNYASINLLPPSLTHGKPSSKNASKKKGKSHPIPSSCDFEEDSTTSIVKGKKMRTYLRYARMALLSLLWILFTIILMTKSEKIKNTHQISIPEGKTISYWIIEAPTTPDMSVTLVGSLLPSAYANLSRHWIKAWIEQTDIPWVPTRGAALLANASSMTSSSAPSRNSSFNVNSDPDVAAAAVAVTLLGPTLDTNASIVRDSSDEPSSKEVEKKTGGYSHSHVKYAKPVSEVWTVPLVSEALVDFVPEVHQQNVFHIIDYETSSSIGLLRLRLKTNLQGSFPVSIGYDPSPINMDDGIVYAAIVLLGLYILIIFDVVHRTLAAILASTMSLAILAALNERPTMAELISWIDIETLLLLFSMMILVAILAETGIFDYLAVFAYKITGGKVWPLINTLCLFTAILSAFLDNVTTTLLMTPVTIRLCEEMKLNPVPILLAMVIYSNIGGTATAVGDPPNVIIASNRYVIDAGIDFSKFTMHMSIGVILAMIVANLQLRFMFRNVKDLRYNNSQEIQELRHEIAICQRAAASLSSYSKDEEVLRDSLLNKAKRLLSELKLRHMTGSFAEENYKANLEELQEKYPIRDWILLVKSGVVLVFVICTFFVHSLPGIQLSLGWTALLGAILLLILADQEDLEGVLARVEWGTLLFFAALFILMEALSRLGLIEWIGFQTEWLIHSVGPEHRLAVAILLIIWVSAMASAFVDNIPLTTVMVRIVTSLAENRELNLPLQPLVWALAFGACLGGNGTLIGASANVVCAGVAEQHGYRFTFVQFFKVGFPITIASVLVATLYLLVCHVALDWNS